jgi:hypothetical protein
MGPSRHHPDAGFPRAYGRDTRPEFGYWLAKREADPARVRVVYGAEPGFDGLNVMGRNLELRLPGTVVHPTLESTCDAAIAAVRARSG